MNVIFQTAKNNEKTVTVDNIFLHSNYNPSREAERFVSSLECSFIPEIIIITEPGLSYVVPYLRQKFPESSIGAIRYIPDFSDYNSLFDFVINFFDFINSSSFETYLFNKLGEEKLLKTYFCKWEPSSKTFKDTDDTVWVNIKNTLIKAKTLLITRQYFEKKWLLNSINFIKYSNKYISVSDISNIPIFVISSGPSLKPYLELLKENQGKAFILCLSSAISVCIRNNIIPDLCLSTDGGYWAGQHLKKLYNTNIPLALPSEAYIPKKLYKQNLIVPLIYSDEILAPVFLNSGLKFSNAKRNGTVSGTALEFSMQLTKGPIYFFGLDLSNQKGFQHTQPNEIQNNTISSYNKISSHEKSSVYSEYSNSSLNIYKEWFENFNTNHRTIYRAIENEHRKNKLGLIKDIDLTLLEKSLSNYKAVNKKNLFSDVKYEKNLEEIANQMRNILISEKTKKQLYPLDYIRFSHEKNDKILKDLEVKHEKFVHQILENF